MLNQMAKVIYVWLIMFVSLYSKRLPVRKRLVYLMSFPKNENGLLKKIIEDEKDLEIILFYEKKCLEEAEKLKKLGVTIFEIKPSFSFIKQVIPILMQSKVILCDNYFPMLAGFLSHKETTIIQLWHANGAIKCFGLEDPTTMSRSAIDRIRFKQVYKHFDEYIVGSEMMGNVFCRSYEAKKKNIITIGYPKTDIYFQQEKISIIQEKFFLEYPELRNKKIILYAPTYRDNKKEENPFNLEQLYNKLGSEYAVLIKKHPHLSYEKMEIEYDNFLYYDLSQFKIEELLMVTSYLITDYSSVPFEFTLLNNAKKILFFCYDKENYTKSTGLQKDFEKWAPGEIVQTMEELIVNLKNEDISDFKEFNQKWNAYNDGEATSRLVQHIKDKLLDFNLKEF